MNRRMVNLACGSSYLVSDEWINLDYSPQGQDVLPADLLAPLLVESNSVDAVYCSHFLEHIPRERVDAFLSECLRILKPGGVLRLVLPDLENLCKEYLDRRQSGEHDKADFVVLEMIDQCVRSVSGGQLGKYYRHIASYAGSSSDMLEYIRYRTGENLGDEIPKVRQNGSKRQVTAYSQRQRLLHWLQFKLLRYRQQIGLAILPAAFREQNVSLAAPGERHQWLWDFHQMESVLRIVGFTKISRQTCQSSCIPDFPCEPLDSDGSGLARKGAESMYLEAEKPFSQGS